MQNREKTQKWRNLGRVDPCFLFSLFVFSSILFSNFSFGQNSTQTVELAAVGDILLTRGVEKKIKRYGMTFPFKNVKEFLSGADIAFGNLENPLTGECDKVDKKYSFQAKPEYSNILSDAGLDILSLSNNHILDCGQTGLTETLDQSLSGSML